MFNKTIAGRRRTLLLTVKPARIDLLSKYLGTRVFDWPRGNFHLARSPLYRERSGKLEVFQRERLETGGRQLKTYPCRTVSVGGFRKKLLYPLRLFAGSFLLHLSHLSRIIVLRRVPVEGATRLGVGVSCQFRNSAGQGIDAVVISSAINREDFSQ